MTVSDTALLNHECHVLILDQSYFLFSDHDNYMLYPISLSFHLFLYTIAFSVLTDRGHEYRLWIVNYHYQIMTLLLSPYGFFTDISFKLIKLMNFTNDAYLYNTAYRGPYHHICL